MTMLRLRGLAKHYARARVPVLAAVDLDVAAGECVALTGASGAGKSTLLHIAAGLLAPDAGTVVIDGHEPWRARAAEAAAFRRRRLGVLLQGPQLFDELDVVTNVALPLLLDRRGDARSRAEARLAAFGLAALAARRPGELSGGEAVRVALARALVADPALLLADEPTSSLDPASSQLVARALAAAARSGAAVLVATHDERLAAAAHRRVDLCDGRIV